MLNQIGQQTSEVTTPGLSPVRAHTNAFANGELLATYDSAGTHFALNDWLGTKRVQVLVQSANSAPVNTVDLTCWNLPFNDNFSCAGSGANATEHQYTGKEHDPYTGLDLFGAREYTNFSGRFLSPDWSSAPDPIPYADLGNPQSLNLYGYAGNNPLTMTDPQVFEKDGLTYPWTKTRTAEECGKNVIAVATESEPLTDY